MKKILLATLIVTFLVAPVCTAEKSIGLTLAQIEADRKAIIEKTVAPTDQQAEAFWQTYWQHRGGVKMLTDRVVEVVEEFAAADGALSGERSAALVIEVMDIEKRRVALKQASLAKFEKILDPRQVVRWYQAERKMDSLIRAEMAATIPFNDLESLSGEELTHANIRSDREALAVEIVQPLENQSNSFLYVYRNYNKKADKLDERIANLVTEYVESEATLTEKQAKQMTKEASEIDAARVKALATMIYSLKSDLTGKQMARLMQCELKMNAITDVVLAAAIPIHQ